MPIRFVIFRKRRLAALCAALAAAAIFTAVNAAPAAVSAAAAQRQLPIYCVERDQKVCSISFDAAWGNGRVRRAYLPVRRRSDAAAQPPTNSSSSCCSSSGSACGCWGCRWYSSYFM